MNEIKMALDGYERLLGPARERFAASAGVQAIGSSQDDAFLHSFLPHFSALGSRMTAPVEYWIRGAADRCAAMGLSEFARGLHGHARAAAGHHLMMIADVRSLTTRWNAHRSPAVDADRLLKAPTKGVLEYCGVHDSYLAGDTPFAQIAIEYEVEMLPLRYGELLVSRCVEMLGNGILSCLSFVTEHIKLDSGHTVFNAQAIAKLLKVLPACLPALVAAGTSALEAYAQSLTDCTRLAERDARNSHAPMRAPSRCISWRLLSPLAEVCEAEERASPPGWLNDVRTLRGSVFFQGGHRPYFQTDGYYSDPDPVDLYAYHILAYDGSKIVGCVRLYRLNATGPAWMTETILGGLSFSTVLHQQETQRSDTVEVGRWVMDPAYRGNGRLGAQLAAAAAMLGSASVAQRNMVVCSVGTKDGQDLMLARIGLTAVPVEQPFRCDNFNDDVRVMSCTGTNQLSPYFRDIMHKIAKMIGLSPVDSFRPG